MAGQFEQVGENLVVHTSSGTFYISASVGGKKKRVSLRTKNKTIAKQRRDYQLKIWKISAGSESVVLSSWSEAIEVTLNYFIDPERRARPLKASSVRDYEEIAKAVSLMVPPYPPERMKEKEVREFWAEIKGKYSAQRANNILAFLKRLGKYVFEPRNTVNYYDKLIRVPIPKREVKVPEREDFFAVVQDMRAQGKANSQLAGDITEFAAYSGMREAEIRGVMVEDVFRDKIRVTGGEAGTKNHEFRYVPIIPAMEELLKRMEFPESGPVFNVSRFPVAALRNACKRLRVPHMSPHSMRHLFVTMCLESGVDFATLAKWVGHKDGGILLAKTYSHIRDRHSQEMAAKVRV